MENVKSMSRESEKIISMTLGVEGICINSSLMTAQNRKRLYFTNIPGITQPEDHHVYLDSIMEAEVDEKYYIKNQNILIERLLEKHSDKMERIGRIMRERGGSPAQADRIYAKEGKSTSLTALAGGLGAKTGLYVCMAQRGRYNEDGSTSQNLEPREDGKTNTLTSVQKDNLVFALSEARTDEAKEIRKQMRASGVDWCPRRGKDLQPRTDGKMNCLTATHGRDHLIFEGARIRRLSPLETERLQGFPDGWTDIPGISENSRYKAMGNAVTVPVIEHILSFMEKCSFCGKQELVKIGADEPWHGEVMQCRNCDSTYTTGGHNVE
jgi:Site-specific DNA methylase